VANNIRALGKNADKMEAPFNTMAKDLAAQYDTAKMTDKTRETLEARQEWLERQYNTDAYFVLEAVAPKSFWQGLMRLGQTSVKEMSQQDLETLQGQIEVLERKASIKGGLEYKRREKAMREKAEQLESALGKLGQLSPEQRGNKGVVGNWFKDLQTNIYPLVEQTGGMEGPVGRMVKDMILADDNYRSFENGGYERMDDVARVLGTNQYKMAGDMQALVDVDLGDGKSISMTRDNLFDLYGVLSDNIGKQSGLNVGLEVGFVVGESVKGVTVPHSSDEGHPMMLTREQAVHVLANAPQDIKKAWWISNEGITQFSSEINEVVFTLTGNRMEITNRNWPRNRPGEAFQDTPPSPVVNHNNIYRPEQASRFQPRSYSRAPIELGSGTAKVRAAIQSQNKLLALGDTMRNQIAVWGSPQVKKAIVRSLGQDGLAKIMSLLDYQARAGIVPSGDKISNLPAVAERKWARVVLPRFTVAFWQGVSASWNLMTTSPKILAKAAAYYAAHPKRVQQRMYDHVHSLVSRHKHQHPGSMIHGPLTSTFPTIGHIRAGLRIMSDKALRATMRLDKDVFCLIYSAGLLEAQKRGIDINSEEADALAREYTLVQLAFFQPGGPPIAQSGAYVKSRHKPWLRPTVWLGGQRNKQFNVVIGAIASGNYRKAMAAMAILAANTALGVTAKRILSKSLYGDDDEWSTTRWGLEVFRSIASNVYGGQFIDVALIGAGKLPWFYTPEIKGPISQTAELVQDGAIETTKLGVLLASGPEETQKYGLERYEAESREREKHDKKVAHSARRAAIASLKTLALFTEVPFYVVEVADALTRDHRPRRSGMIRAALLSGDSDKLEAARKLVKSKGWSKEDVMDVIRPEMIKLPMSKRLKILRGLSMIVKDMDSK
jgi:hypothetical protein